MIYDWICRDKDGLHLFAGEPDWSDASQHWCIGMGPAIGSMTIDPHDLHANDLAMLVSMNYKCQLEPVKIELQTIGTQKHGT